MCHIGHKRPGDGAKRYGADAADWALESGAVRQPFGEQPDAEPPSASASQGVLVFASLRGGQDQPRLVYRPVNSFTGAR